VGRVAAPGEAKRLEPGAVSAPKTPAESGASSHPHRIPLSLGDPAGAARPHSGVRGSERTALELRTGTNGTDGIRQ
jgi:hypothetical protein